MENQETEAKTSAHAAKSAHPLAVMFLVSVVTSLLVLLAAFGFWHSQREWLQPLLFTEVSTHSAEEVNGTAAEIAALKARLATLETRQHSFTKTIKTPDAEVLKALQQQVTALKHTPAAADNGAEIAALREQVSQLMQLQQSTHLQLERQRAERPADMRIPAVFQSLRSKAIEGMAFEDAYQRFLALAQPYPLLVETTEKLADYAGTGRPLLSEVQRSFRETLRDYLRDKDGVDSSLSGKIRQNMTQFITIRNLEDTGDSTLAMINRAEKAVAQGDILKARQELAELPQDVAPFFAAWEEEAKAHLEIPAILLKIDQRIADMLMQQTQPAATRTQEHTEEHDS
jgi:hypothetical protein